MNSSNYLVEGIIQNIKLKNKMKKDAAAQNKKSNERQLKYIAYQQRGGKLSIENFEDPEMLQYEKDHNKNPKLYKNFKTWKKIKYQEATDKANLEEKISKNKRRRAQAEHESSIAEKNRIKNKQMESYMEGYRDALLEIL
jgi:hypothetical protein